jgi:hypothetical protein
MDALRTSTNGQAGPTKAAAPPAASTATAAPAVPSIDPLVRTLAGGVAATALAAAAMQIWIFL